MPSPTDVRSIADLARVVAAGQRAKFLFFWSHEGPRDGTVSAACLSQWFHARFDVAGQRYPTAEHFMMAEKARLFGDETVLPRILEAPSPGAAKALGREVRGFSEDTWVDRRFEITVAGNVAKFEQNPELLAYLLGTKKRVLVEASPRDRIWGIGLEASDPRASNPSQWRGLNLLGFALMEARERLATSRPANV